ncbi:glutathione S-transferase [Melampsora americana]|nr:glutathione S-transferase [Melampsora americana]
MSHGKQFTLYSHKGGPNGWKVAFLLEELGLSYETVYFDFKKGEQKSDEHTKLNPNGRIPTIVDHKNSDFTLWESNAILEYLAYTYDKEGKFTVSKPEDKYKQLQWLFFQSSGQGPYFSQAIWFKSFHPEKFPSAIERYQNEVKRVSGVLDSVLSKQEWLIGEKFTIADLSFIPWHFAAIKILDGTDFSKEYPALDKWFKKMTERPAIKKVWNERNALNDV